MQKEIISSSSFVVIMVCATMTHWCDLQLRPATSAFEELYQNADSLSNESDDEDEETTMMSQAVWEGVDDRYLLHNVTS